ncbi:amino acid transporter [Panaeolus papilionaceus]|nr:amino acid transporter [Panaeolus papilionaceus]
MPYEILQVRDDGEDIDAEPSSEGRHIPGAPVEETNPLGQQLTLTSAVMMNIGAMIGSGIYSIPGIMFGSLGSVGLLLGSWLLAPLFALAGLAVYAEYASLFPLRSGGDVVYLEQAYPKPRFLVPIAFALTTILVSSGTSTFVIFSQYFLSAFSIEVNARNQVAVCITTILVVSTCASISTRFCLKVVNVLSSVKVLFLGFIVANGIAMFLGFTSVEDPYANFRHPFVGSVWNLNALSTAFIKSNHAFLGWHNSFNMLAEVKSSDPVRTVGLAGLITILFGSTLFLFVNIAFVAALSKEQLETSGSLIASLFFQNLYGPGGRRFLDFMVAISTLSGALSTSVAFGRIYREIARQGLLPYPNFFSSVKPFGTPARPIFFQAFIMIFMMVLVPAKDIFNFLVDLSSYPAMIFQAALCMGIWAIRRRRKEEKTAKSPYQAHDSIVVIYLISCILLLVLPWVPPDENRGGDVSFWYASYCVAGIALLLFCGVYYWFWAILLPKWGGYEIVEQVEESEGGVKNTRLVRRYVHHGHSSTEEDAPLLPPARAS